MLFLKKIIIHQLSSHTLIANSLIIILPTRIPDNGFVDEHGVIAEEEGDNELSFLVDGVRRRHHNQEPQNVGF